MSGGPVWGFEVSAGEFNTKELRSAFPAGLGPNMIAFPPGALGVCPPDPPLWQLPQTTDEWDALRTLVGRMSDPSAWKAHETNKHSDELRDKHLVHHFHLDGGRRPRSEYRWFAFRDPGRFGNVWFNLGGTYLPQEYLEGVWRTPVWFDRIRAFYPWVASAYRIRGVPIPLQHPQLPDNVRSVWHNKRDGVYGVVRLDGDVYVYPGMATDIRHLDPSGWMFFTKPWGMFAMHADVDIGSILATVDTAGGVMDELLP